MELNLYKIAESKKISYEKNHFEIFKEMKIESYIHFLSNQIILTLFHKSCLVFISV